jgi:Rrf2 family protein
VQISTKSRYAVRALIELALHYEKGPLQLKEIARRQDLSEKYLEQIMHPLRTKGLVYSQKGSQGGYCLARPPKDITMLHIVSTMEGSITPVACVDKPQLCDRLEVCSTRDVWSRLKETIAQELDSHTLEDLALEQERKAASRAEGLTYQI